MSHRKRTRRIRWHSVYLWHRYMGLTAAAFVVILAVTGITLNHTETWGMDSRKIYSELLLDWYGIRTPKPLAFTVADHWVSQFGKRIYFDNQEILEVDGQLIGATRINDIIVIAVPEHLVLTTLEGHLIERLDSVDGVPAGMQAITSKDDSVLILAAYGAYVTDSYFIEWREIESPTSTWSSPTELPSSLKRQLTDVYLGSALTLERVILDIHSGRILGPWGIYVMDVAAVLFLLLAAAGIWLWVKRSH